MSVVDVVRELVEPLAAEADLSVYDVTMVAGKLQVTLSRPSGVDLEDLRRISRALEAELDERDLISGAYTLEVSSPGLERNLRTPEHFIGAIGSEVTVRTRGDVDGERRVRGILVSADADTATVSGDDGERVLAYADIERARTIFVWGPAEKPKRPNKPSGKPGAGSAPDKKAGSS